MLLKLLEIYYMGLFFKALTWRCNIWICFSCILKIIGGLYVAIAYRVSLPTTWWIYHLVDLVYHIGTRFTIKGFFKKTLGINNGHDR